MAWSKVFWGNPGWYWWRSLPSSLPQAVLVGFGKKDLRVSFVGVLDPVDLSQVAGEWWPERLQLPSGYGDSSLTACKEG